LRIRSLSIKNYRSIKKLDINFPESGLIGIIGHNGAGKSSLLESIGWALYGNQAIKSRGKADGVTTIGAKGKCRVSMEFDHGEDGPYLVERTLKDAKLERGGKQIAVMTSGVNSKVENLLNMDYRAFYTSIFTQQGGLGSFTRMTASERQETVERLLEVSKVKDARKTIRTEARDLENHLHGKRVAIQSEEEIIDKIAELKQSIGQLKDTERKLEKLKKDAEENKNEAEKKLKKIDAKQRTFHRAKEDSLRLENKLRLYETELRNTKQGISEIESKLDRAKTKLIELKGIISYDVTKELEKKVKESEDVSKQVAETSDTLRERQIQYNERIVAKQEHIDQIEKLGRDSECPICLRPLGEHGPEVIDELKREIQTIKKENSPEKIRELKAVIESLNKKTRLLERDIGKLNERNFRKRTAEAEVRNLGLDNLELDKKRMSTNLKEWTEKIKKQERIVKESKSKLEKIGFDESKYNSIRDKWDKAGDNLNLCIVDLERHRIGVARASENLKNQEEKFQEISRLKSEIKDEERTLHLLRTLEERLKGFRTYLTGRIAPVLQNRTGERLSQITQARYNSVHVDRNDYSIQVMDGTQLYPLERFSGGEIDAFNLAFRLSISDVITERLGSELGMVVLDEVLGSQDYQRQISILEGLEALAKNIGQVLMVTHIEDMKNQLQHVWSVSLDQKKGTQVIKL